MSDQVGKVLIARSKVDAAREIRFRTAVALLKRLEQDAEEQTNAWPTDAASLLKVCSEIVDSASWDWQAQEK